MISDLTSKGVPGKVAAQALDRAGIVTNYNSVPFDKRKPFDPSGIRFGTPAITSRGMGADEMKKLAGWMVEIIENVEDESVVERVRGEVSDLCAQFPAPGLLVD